MSSEPHWVVSLIIAWLPFVVFIAMCIYCTRQLKRGLFTRDGRSIGDVLAELAIELRYQNEKLR